MSLQKNLDYLADGVPNGPRQTIDDIDFEHLAKHIRLYFKRFYYSACQQWIVEAIRRHVIGDPQEVFEAMVDLGYIEREVSI